MKTTVLLLAAVLSCANASFLLDYTLPDSVIQLMGLREKPTNRAISVCQDIQFNYCQARFNEFFGFSPEKFLEMNVTEFTKVCNTRTQFYQCLGTSYYSCLSLFTLLNRPNPDFPNTFDYVRTFRGLEYACTGGFQEVAFQWDCLGTFPTTNSYKNCITQFNATVGNDLCSAVDATGQCLNDAYRAACNDAGAGFFGCENFRSTFSDACWGLRCQVNQF
ncbi:unnamed protein product [Caenorhabditis auriculariae]|uniref:DUF19 domain-containing protein n=1 Tax=Caenorhabditis auriculariae TaxID=2777116 RepID=A0A8S1HMD4_9PELO|nr:unnamed protein product [Caenorhabditis auriculariae]